MNRRGGLRVAHVTASFPPYAGGTGNVAWFQTRELARLGHEVHVFTTDRGGPRTAPLGVRVHRLRPLVRIGNAPLLPALLTRLRGFDLVHLHYPFYSGGELVWLASHLFRVPYVVTYHHDVQLAGVLAVIPPLHHRLFGERILHGAGRVLFTTRDYGRSSLGAHLLARPTTGELPNGVDLERFFAGQGDGLIRRKFGIRGDEVLALFVGGLDRPHYFKGLSVLLDALRHPGCALVRLVVVGHGDLREGYERRVVEMGLAGRVQFAGYVPDAALPAYYGDADFLVLPSTTRSEAFGLVLLEALACGTPVIATDLPGVRAVVRATRGGIIVPTGDPGSLAAAMAGLAADAEGRKRLGEQGRERVREHFGWHTIGPRLDKLYREVVPARSEADLSVARPSGTLDG